MRLVFLGSPEAAVPSLNALLDAGHDVALVVTQPDRRRGRGNDLIPTPVKAAAIAHGIPTTETVDDVLAVGAELGVVVAFGKIIKPHVLDALPMVNVHFSLLPRWRGAAPGRARHPRRRRRDRRVPHARRRRSRHRRRVRLRRRRHRRRDHAPTS